MRFKMFFFILFLNAFTVIAGSNDPLTVRVPGDQSAARLFDQQRFINLSIPARNDRFTCALFFQNQFWTGDFGSPRIRRFSLSGSLVDSLELAGLPDDGITSITTDGNLLYIAQDHSSYLYEADPGTLAVTDSILMALQPNGVAYDSIHDAFWIAYDDYAFFLVDRNGATLQTIPSSVHGLAGVYGLAFDAATGGGPYLWAFARVSASGLHRVVRIPVATGIPDGVSFPVMERLGDSLAYGQAGGLSVANGIAPGKLSLVGVIQGLPDDWLFTIELSSDTVFTADAELDTVRLSPPYTQVPLGLAQSFPLNWDFKLSNRGTDTLSLVQVQITVSDTAGSVLSNTGTNVSDLVPGERESGSFPTGLIPALPGNVVVTAGLQSAPADQFPTNDSLRFFIQFSDSTIAYDQGPVYSGFGIGNNARLGQAFDLPVPAGISSISFSLESPTPGDSLRAEIWSYNVAPVSQLVQSVVYRVPPGYVPGTLITLPLEAGVVSLNAGQYFVCLFEYNNPVSLSANWKNYRYRKAWAKGAFGSWMAMETSDLFITFCLRVNIGQLINTLGASPESDELAGFPNPAITSFELVAARPLNGTIAITDLQGRVVRLLQGSRRPRQRLDIGDLQGGVYVVKTEYGNIRVVKTD